MELILYLHTLGKPQRGLVRYVLLHLKSTGPVHAAVTQSSAAPASTWSGQGGTGLHIWMGTAWHQRGHAAAQGRASVPAQWEGGGELMNLTCSPRKAGVTVAVIARAAATRALPVCRRGFLGWGHWATLSLSQAHRATLSPGSCVAPLAPTETASLTVRHDEK